MNLKNQRTEEQMTKTESLIAQVYSAFNQRNIDGALAFMSESVSWPKASEGGRGSARRRFEPTGAASGKSLILMSTHSRCSNKGQAELMYGCINW
jgi:hypothetical protein